MIAAPFAEAQGQALALRTRGPALAGVVTDTMGRALPLAFITEERGWRSTVADDSGRFHLAGLKGRFTILVRRMGYRPARLEADLSSDTTVVVSFRLIPLPLTLDPIEVTGPRPLDDRALYRVGFYERLRDKQLGALTGTFITPGELERRAPERISQALQGVAGVQVKHLAGDPMQFVVLWTRR